MDYSSLLSSFGVSTGPSGWEYAGVILGALGAVALWFVFTFIIKGKGEGKRNIVEDIKNFFTMKGNFALDLAMIVYWYMTIRTLISSFGLFGTANGFWEFLKTVIGQLVWYRFVYEIIKAIVKKNADKAEK